MSVVTFPSPRRTETSLAGFVLGRAQVLFQCDPNGIALTERCGCVPHDVHHGFVKVEGDERLLQIIVAPVEAKIEVAGRPVTDLFPVPEEMTS